MIHNWFLEKDFRFLLYLSTFSPVSSHFCFTINIFIGLIIVSHWEPTVVNHMSDTDRITQGPMNQLMRETEDRKKDGSWCGPTSERRRLSTDRFVTNTS